MRIILQIALRNLREHRIKSIIICFVIALGMFLLVVGNSIIDTGRLGMKKSFVQSYSGDILVGPLNKDQSKPSMFRSDDSPITESFWPTVPDYQANYELLRTFPGVEKVDPQVYGGLLIEINEDWRAYLGLFGVDSEAYGAMFPDNLEILQGHMLGNGETGIMLPEKIYNEIKTKLKLDYSSGKEIKLLSLGNGTRIKNVPIAGVFRFKHTDLLKNTGFLDVASLRYMLGMVVGASGQIRVEDGAQDMLGVSLDNLDSFYNDAGNVIVQSGNGGQVANLSQEKLNHILGDTSQRSELAKADSGAWHYVLLRLKDGADPRRTIRDLNEALSQKGTGLVAVDWEEAAGVVATIGQAAQLFFLVLVVIISVVSVIVIMNTMVVSIVERTAEIGTMRALGAQKTYIRGIFLAETFLLSMVGGIGGLLVAGALIAVLNSVGIPAPQSIFEIVFGGKILYPVLSWASAAQAMVIMILVGLFSSLYPTAIALRITPVKAMQSR